MTWHRQALTPPEASPSSGQSPRPRGKKQTGLPWGLVCVVWTSGEWCPQVSDGHQTSPPIQATGEGDCPRAKLHTHLGLPWSPPGYPSVSSQVRVPHTALV